VCWKRSLPTLDRGRRLADRTVECGDESASGADCEEIVLLESDATGRRLRRRDRDGLGRADIAGGGSGPVVGSWSPRIVVVCASALAGVAAESVPPASARRRRVRGRGSGGSIRRAGGGRASTEAGRCRGGVAPGGRRVRRGGRSGAVVAAGSGRGGPARVLGGAARWSAPSGRGAGSGVGAGPARAPEREPGPASVRGRRGGQVRRRCGGRRGSRRRLRAGVGAAAGAVTALQRPARSARPAPRERRTRRRLPPPSPL